MKTFPCKMVFRKQDVSFLFPIIPQIVYNERVGARTVTSGANAPQRSSLSRREQAVTKFYTDQERFREIFRNLHFPMPQRGDAFGHLIATGNSGFCETSPSQKLKYETAAEFTCLCGVTRFYRLKGIRSGAATSCGCQRHKTTAKPKREPKYRRLNDLSLDQKRIRKALYFVWVNMLRRCSDPDNDAYHRYGGRGIFVCSEWAEFEPFLQWSLRTGYESGLTIDRINNDGHYHEDNCKWSTAKQQGRNKSDNRLVAAWGETKCLSEWAEDPRCVVKRSTIFQRLEIGVDPEIAISTPIVKKWDGPRGRSSSHLFPDKT